jgi:phosphohistidine phosphatase SixA
MTKNLISFILAILVLSSCTRTYYIVRHAEKATQEANMSSDVPLTDKGKQRAAALQEVLKGKKIRQVFSTNTIRTKSTAQPTADYFHVPVEIYGPRPDSTFIQLLKSKKKGTLVVGHSNTVDDIVNMLCGEKKVPADLPDGEYNKLFVVKLRGKKAHFTEGAILSTIISEP